MKSLKAKIIIMLMAVLVVLTSGLSILNYSQASKNMQDLGVFLLQNNLKHNMSIAYTYLDKYYGNVAYQNGILVDKNGKGIAGDTQMVDALSADAGGVATIFAKSGDDFVRISTNIVNDKGERAVGTMLGKSSPAYADVSQGKKYLGQADILNKSYLTAYNPLFDPNGQIIGLLFVGIPQSESAAQIQVYLDQFRNTSVLVIIIALLLALLLAYYIGKGISKPIISITSNMQKIASGDLSIQLDDNLKKRKDEIGALTKSLAEIVQSIKGLTDETNALAESTLAGKLDARIDVTKHQGEYRKVVEGINNTLAAIIGPLNMAAEYIGRIAKGDTPPIISDNYYGDFNEIKNSLNLCINEISTLVDEIGVVINASAEGNLDQRTDVNRVQGVYKKMLRGINTTLDDVIEPIKECAAVADELSQGRLKVRVVGEYQGDHARMKEALNTTIDNLNDIITEESEILTQLGQGNLDVIMDRDYKGDYKPISTAIKSIISSMNEVMGHINRAADQVASGSEQISGSSQALAQGASEQASAVEQLTSAVTEIAAQTKLNASKANQASELALSARDDAAKGKEQMKEMLTAMEGINESSANISRIIKVIDDIAFQTNILALNAAVEAAHAGQHGKGFAVVAEEVRNLAARSAGAAKETTNLIEGSIHKVQSGTQLANETAQALNKIAGGISQAANLVGDIAVASNEQATGIAQIDQGIVQVSQVVQNNSATAQQSAAASVELSEQAELLKNDVAKFRLKQSYSKFQGDSKEIWKKPERQFAPGMAEAAVARSGGAKIEMYGDYGKY